MKDLIELEVKLRNAKKIEREIEEIFHIINSKYQYRRRVTRSIEEEIRAHNQGQLSLDLTMSPVESSQNNSDPIRLESVSQGPFENERLAK